MEWLWYVIVVLRGASPDPDDRWAARLTELDRSRATAFARADPDLLDAVYVEGSTAARSDAATIRGYTARGGRVVGADLRILSCRVIRESRLETRLEVVDRLGPARVAWRDGSTTSLPRDRPTRRIVTLVRTDDGWRISGSQDLSRLRPAQWPGSSADRARRT